MNTFINRINSYEDYKAKMQDYKNHLEYLVKKGGKDAAQKVFIITGDKGVGKSYVAEEILEANKATRNYVIKKGSTSPVQFYKLLWDNNDAIAVLDDISDLILDPKTGAAVLKAATDSKPVRTLSWDKQNPKCIKVSVLAKQYNITLKDNDDIKKLMDVYVAGTSTPKKKSNIQRAHEAGETFPDMFFFTGAVVILTNKRLDQIDHASEGALSNRGWHQEMTFTLDGAIDLLRNSFDMMKHYGEIERTDEHIKAAFDYLTTPDALQFFNKTGRIPTLRTFGKIIDEIENNIITVDSLNNNTEPPAF